MTTEALVQCHWTADHIPHRYWGAGEWCRCPGIPHEETQEALQNEIALLRKQLRNAWSKLECRCIFNDKDEKIHEDSHCPYHGWYQQDPDNWDPLGDFRTVIVGLQKQANEARIASVLLLEAVKAHVEELEDAWQRGALSEHDGQGGTRSTRNVEVRVAVNAMLERLKAKQ